MKNEARINGRIAKKGKSTNKMIYLMYIILLSLYIIYFLDNIEIVGLAALILTVAILVIEFRSSIRSEGFRKTVYEVAWVLGMVMALFLAVSFMLQTSTLQRAGPGAPFGFHIGAPLDVVASCSMLPVLHRGDLVILHGINNISSFLQSHSVPVVNVSSSAFDNMVNNMGSEFLEPLIYLQNNKSKITSFAFGTAYSVGFYNSQCLIRNPEPSSSGSCFANQLQDNNLIRYSYSIGNVMVNNSKWNIPYTSSITIGNTIITENYSGPIIVYRATSRDYFSGDIIHRLYAAIRVGNNYYLLTKGDNNPILDIEALNYPANASTDIIGYMIGDIPGLGYPSLIIKGQIGSVPGCNEQILH